MTLADSLVSILDGNTFVVSDSRGDIEASATDPSGLFAFDTRFLSRWVLTVNGQRLNALSTDDLQYFEVQFFLVPATGTTYIDARLSVMRRRAVGDGFHEELSILNHDSQPVDLTIRIDAASDFADLFEVKDALAKQGTYHARVTDGQLHLGYQRETFQRETVISASVPARLDEQGLSFHVQIKPHGSWTTDLSVVTAITGHGETLRRPKYGRGDLRPRPNMERSLELWLEQAPRLECDWDALREHLSAQPGGSRCPPLLAGDCAGAKPAGSRPALVHDHVRARQHLHQPPGVAVRARAGGSDLGRAGRMARKSRRRLPR
jgi:hypothetical protein